MKKIKLIALASLCFFAVGCSGTSSTSSETSTDSSTTTNYPAVTLSLKAIHSEVEIGQKVEVRAIVATSDANKTCTFTSSDTSIATVEIESNGVWAKVTGIKAGDVTITCTSVVNPNITASVKITVITSKPTLKEAVKKVQQLESYTINITEITDSDSDDIATIRVTDTGIIYTDPYGYAMHKTDDKLNLFGEIVNDNGDVVYMVQDSDDEFITTDATIVQTNSGLLSKSNFKGNKGESLQAFEVGDFYSFDAINPDWLSDTKTDNNEYVIDGSNADDSGVPTYIKGSYVESLLWKMADPNGYSAAVSDLGENYFFSIADKIDTEITVVSSDTIKVDIEVKDTGTTYRLEMADVNDTSLDDDELSVEDEFKSATASTPVKGAKIDKAIAAIKTDNYVRVNSLFPDHSTEIKYSTYYTPNYVFYDCDANFVNEYNTHRSSDTDEWTDTPYGYIKKADGIYKFTYDETKETVTVENEKQANTDANTKLSEFDNYFSNLKTFSNDWIYSFKTEEEAVWNNRGTKYYITSSRRVFDEFMDYYSPEDKQELVENVKAGIGVELDASGNVSAINGTLGATPFNGAEGDITTHTYGVNYFVMNNFGAATTNKVDALLK